MKILRYRITLLENGLFKAVEGDPNSTVTYNFIPGSVLRGALVARYIQANGSTPLDAADTDVQALFLRDQVRYLNGYLVLHHETTANGKTEIIEKRGLPAPLSWMTVKGQKGPMYDFAREVRADDQVYKGRGEQFAAILGSQALIRTTERTLIVHNARSRSLGRPAGEDGGAVFRYISLNRGQVFEAAVLCETDQLAAKIAPLLDGEANLGRSRQAGYGPVRLEKMGDAPADWREAGENNLSSDMKSFTITLLSDALVRGAGGTFGVDCKDLEAVVQQVTGGTLKTDAAFLNWRVVGGFNRKWGLPLPQALAVRMGSTLVFTTEGCTKEGLKKLEDQGIGEHRLDGFGRVAVNWSTQKEYAEIEPDKTRSIEDVEQPAAAASGEGKTQGIQLDLASKSGKIAQQMANRLLRQQLDGQVMHNANKLGSKIHGPRPSQLGRLMQEAQNALLQDWTNEEKRAKIRKSLLNYLKSIESRQVTRNQFSAALLAWLNARFSDPEAAWKDLDVNLDQPLVGAVKAVGTADLKFEYSLRLVIAVLGRALKETQQKEMKG